MSTNKLYYTPIDFNLQLDKEEILQNFNPSVDWNFWKFEKLTDNSNGKYGVNKFSDIALIRYPNLCKYISNLPFVNISNIKINIQKEAAIPHIDFVSPEQGQDLYQNNVNNEPCGYRILVNGKSDAVKIHKDGKVYTCNMPSDTDLYVIDSSSVEHSVDQDYERVTVYITGFIDKSKHNQLIDNSLKKYKDYAIYG